MRKQLGRWRARRRLRDHLGLWYHPDYDVEALAETARTLGLDPRRSEKIVGCATGRLRLPPGVIRLPHVATVAELSSVHPHRYLDQTNHPSYLGRVFGLPTEDIDAEPLITSQRRQVGATIEAARWVVEKRGRVGFQAGGGFHHAEPEAGMGFCVYNDIAVAIAQLRSAAFGDPIAIVDLDFHQGNGNIVAFENDETVLTYSIHGSQWTHTEAVSDAQYLLPSGAKDAEYLETLRNTLPDALRSHGPALVFYVAGNDILRDDLLGEFELTGEGVFERDRCVAEATRACDASLVVTLGGGYSRDAWRPSADFLHWLLTDEVIVSTPEPENLTVHCARVADALSPLDLQRESGDFSLTEEDLMGDLAGPTRQSRRLLDYYTSHGVEFVLEEYGLMDELRELGFEEPRLSMDPSDPQRQRVSMHGHKDGEEHLLVELLVGLSTRSAPAGVEPGQDLRFLSIEWMMLQNPTESFSLRRPQLPGQTHPGLGVGERLMNMLLQAARRLELDGISHNPSRYHIAFIGASQFIFLDPVLQGRFEALRAALGDMDLAEAAWLMERGEVVDGEGQRIEWAPEVCVVPVGERMFQYFASAGYQEAKAEARNEAEVRGIETGA
ncbi:MAG: histone deacetylase [Myxococcota bacterium]